MAAERDRPQALAESGGNQVISRRNEDESIDSPLSVNLTKGRENDLLTLHQIY